LAVEFGVAALPGLLFTRLAASCALGEGRDRTFAILTVLPWATNAVTVTLLAFLDELTSQAALVAFTASTIGVALLSFVAVVSWLRPRVDLTPWRNDAYATGIRVFPGVLAQLGNYRLDQVVIAATLPSADLGLYTVAVAGSEAGTLPAQATANAIMPRARQADQTRLFLRAGAVSAALVVLVVPLFVAAVAFGLPGYEDALLPFFVLIPGAAALAASKVLAAVVTGRGDPWQASRVALVTLGVTAVATGTLVPLFGIIGAAFASTFAYGLSAWLLLRAAMRPRNGKDDRSAAPVKRSERR
jgi:O-antigen/teichoic acid export membrane protein